MRRGLKIFFACSVLIIGAVAFFINYSMIGMMRTSRPMPDRTSNYIQIKIDAVDRALAEMGFGSIAFNTPITLNINDTASIQLLLSLAASTEELKKRISDEGNKVGTRIKVSDRMEARLSGSNFTITAVTPEVQAISQYSTTEWKWDISPAKEGKHYLHLTISALIDVDGSSTPRAIRTFDKTIEVQVTWKQKICLFIDKNWQWLWAVILAPFTGWLWKRSRKAN